MVPQFLTLEQSHGLACYQKEMKQAAALLRSVAPDQWQVGELTTIERKTVLRNSTHPAK
jgi:hypothetical protein